MMLEDVAQHELLELLATGEMTPLGTLPWGSNYTFLTQITKDEPTHQEVLAVYKPRRGEAPLWDFPTGTLCLREYAAWLVSEALGWHLVPPTVLRDGDYGFGSVQLFIENDPAQHYFTFRDDPSACDQLRRIALFDLITNNADRKSGHCLRDPNGRIWAIDHGICFNAEYKLRTVIWDFAGQPIPEDLLGDLARLRLQVEPHHTLGKALRNLLSAEEVNAFAKRIEALLRLRVFPKPNRYERNIPWPPI